MKKFLRVSVEQFKNYLNNFKINRSIKEIHIHHTWKPDYDDWYRLKENNPTNLNKIIEGMYNYHVNTLGWDDIGQNITVDPDGFIWICRDLNMVPCSIVGRNKNAIAIENIGNFDKNKDKITEEQLNTLIKLVDILCRKCELAIETSNIIYHNEYSSKSCPGNAFISKSKLINSLIENTEN